MFSDYSCAVEVEGTILSTFPLLSIAQVETESFLCVQSIIPCSFFYEVYNVFSFCPLTYTEIQLLTTQTFLRYKNFFFKKLIEYTHDVKDFFYIGRILDQGWL